MATKSILKTVDIRTEKSARRLADALEHASGQHAKPVECSQAVYTASAEDARRIFGRSRLTGNS